MSSRTLVWRLRASKRFPAARVWIRYISSNPPDPPPPELCCMSGCSNCVWIEYAKELKEFSNGESDKNIEEALKKIEDPSFRSFIKMEINGILSKPRKK